MRVNELEDYINRTSQSGSILGMESIVDLCGKLGNPQEHQKVIHIAGTNGKGSTGILLQNALISMGYKVGRFSSPAVFSYEEMFQIQGENISRQRLALLYTKVEEACKQMEKEGKPHPTIFEVETAAAYTFFFEEKCDFSIIEVGMGGRTDATNLVNKPVVSVITSISMDHTAFLGDTVEKIASMKAGIIKKGCPVVALWQKESVRKVLEEEADRCNTTMTYAIPGETKVLEMTPEGMKLRVYEGETIQTKVAGLVQIENITCARTVLEVLSSNKEIDLTHEKQQEKMLAGFWNISWAGRFETIANDPRIIIDGAHNEDAAIKLAKTIEAFFPNRTIRFIAGVLRDKDYTKMMETVLPFGVEIFCVTPKNTRGLPGKELAEVAKKYIKEVHVSAGPAEAIQEAISHSNREDVIIAFGSLSYLWEVRKEVCQKDR